MVQFENYIGAGYPALWVQTHEEDRAVAGLAERVPAYGAFVWDLVAGLRELNQNSARQIKDPKIAVEAAAALPEKSVLFLKDFHRFIGAVETLRTVKNILPYLKSTCRHIAFVSPVVQIPVELQKEITVMDFGLPSTQELMKVARRILEDCELSGSAADERVIEAARGLTLAEAEDAFALSLLMKKEYSREILESQKLQIIKKSGLMELYQAVPESQLGGHERLKKYVRNRKRGFEEPGLPAPRGILIVGPPGCGKTLSVKVIAAVLGFPLIRLDMAGLKGSLVGQSEERMRQATALIDAVSPCVVLFDELEKSIGGVQSSNRTDGGTSAAMFAHLLTWQESEVPKYIAATCNGIEDILSLSQGALIRRFDDVFYLDLPSEFERREILEIMNRRYGTDIPQDMASRMQNWTGAEIEKFVKASVYDGIEDAIVNVKPVYEQNRDIIERTRQWARMNARLANADSGLTQVNTLRRIAR